MESIGVGSFIGADRATASQLIQARAFLNSCANLLSIGHDGDIISSLETIPRGSRLMIVGMGDQDGQKIFHRMCSRTSDIGRKKLVAAFYNAGFSEFIRSGELERYLTRANRFYLLML